MSTPIPFKLFPLSYDTVTFSVVSKYARVQPISKKGMDHQSNNRPIALVSKISNVIEKIKKINNSGILQYVDTTVTHIWNGAVQFYC